MRIVFTGPATDHNGTKYNRVAITAATVKAGHIVRDKVDSTVDVLVASRGDTAKATNALKYNVLVCTYAEWCQVLEEAGVKIDPVGTPNRYTDEVAWDGKLGSLL